MLDEQLGDAHLETASDAEASAVYEQSEPLATEMSSDTSVEHATAAKPVRLAVSAEHRERLLDRLAHGATNAELAAEFGVSLRQVQGLRMGCAREIARRRDQLGKGSARMEPTSLPASVEEIVRYLRQQDEVVVQQPNGDFLLNGRFNLTLADLLARANRMRSRQNKPSFESLGGMPVGEKKSVSERTSVVLGSVGKLAPRFIKRLPTRCNPDCAKARSSSVEHCHYMAEVGGSIPSRAYQITCH